MMKYSAILLTLLSGFFNNLFPSGFIFTQIPEGKKFSITPYYFYSQKELPFTEGANFTNIMKGVMLKTMYKASNRLNLYANLGTIGLSQKSKDILFDTKQVGDMGDGLAFGLGMDWNFSKEKMKVPGFNLGFNLTRYSNTYQKVTYPYYDGTYKTETLKIDTAFYEALFSLIINKKIKKFNFYVGSEVVAGTSEGGKDSQDGFTGLYRDYWSGIWTQEELTLAEWLYIPEKILPFLKREHTDEQKELYSKYVAKGWRIGGRYSRNYYLKHRARVGTNVEVIPGGKITADTFFGNDFGFGLGFNIGF